VDWDSVDPIPEALAELMASPGDVDPPLDDVVPGDQPTHPDYHPCNHPDHPGHYPGVHPDHQEAKA
jgi:hypothetical protein